MTTSAILARPLPRRVLVIEDDVHLSEALRRALAHAGLQPTVAATGKEGLRAIQHGGHDVVLLDLNLPDASGIAVLRSMRAMSNHRPVVILTNSNDPADRSAAEAAGAAAYLLKYQTPLADVISLVRQLPA